MEADPLFIAFFQLLPRYGVPISLQYILEFQSGLERGLVKNLDSLFVFLKLTVVKKAEHLDAFERAFAFYFLDIDIPNLAEGDPALLSTPQFKAWLKNAIAQNEITGPVWKLSQEELIRKFWETLKAQLERHDGGNRWVGTGGSSPFGHSGMAQPGVRVHGPGGNRSAIKAIGQRNFIDYASSNALKGSNIRQALASLKQLKPSGAHTELDIERSIQATAKNGGEIELVFQRDLKDKITVMLLIDNGGMSMLPHIDLTRLVFEKLKDRFKSLKIYYFHNTIYQSVFKDARHQERIETEKLLQASPETRVIFVGDASMGPGELVSPYGSLYFEDETSEPSLVWLNRFKKRFPHLVWLNPLPKESWDQTYGSWTLNTIRSLIQMEDLSLNGIKRAVGSLNQSA
ncbi:hypothetical protein COW36_11290 [bacterium (Candidatus Blackallbacteria) CG17_big_fil_post_rev_8_21_14_2_50_48_46]|uniref:VWA containing CoxE family protein n=1 Tax=bacterium (Candidatus Blackallbacteria) CG17_big_fil_post_rev_8_21_14_2_50_48_46 TaxID=2014261 RepID=A0A2M7G4N6_9BACT|nr:MAG: hypothetical protein COW64_18385 [bacterium (Candidatus Blackallbacteria) CG18_big_fil_WC_8_21_14_2_50_49_26]PIW16859.1 MAG: hypothetical protein COW36_11290 [bacterium (Candidatus Blackallbacteria) CG17_big_fil_post_rev_8_21_14_2_50_48_46]PIW48056.1 MAG: hypothetical protein COW20_11005 [bacterium (Candidatus Blackallbacteria) CG13_big_fil_rev_8_21_14_2_50_49_14]